MIDMLAMIAVFSCIGLYLSPLIVAKAREHHDTGRISMINIFFGWTFIGWIVALAMALSAVRRA